MKKFIYILFIYLIVVFNLQAQDISEAIYFCQTNLTSKSGYDGKNTLYFSNFKSLYIHDDFPRKSENIINETTFRKIEGDIEGLPVFIDRKENIIVWKETCCDFQINYILSDTISNIHWSILPIKKKIGQYQCQQAVGKFGGRIYDVFFTEEIPSSFGPYKLNGLPGLIIWAKSRDDRVFYELIKFIPKSSREITIDPPNIGIEMTTDEYDLMLINLVERTRARSTAKVKVEGGLPRENSTIEKNRFDQLERIDKILRNRKN